MFESALWINKGFDLGVETKCTWSLIVGSSHLFLFISKVHFKSEFSKVVKYHCRSLSHLHPHCKWECSIVYTIRIAWLPNICLVPSFPWRVFFCLWLISIAFPLKSPCQMLNVIQLLAVIPVIFLRLQLKFKSCLQDCSYMWSDFHPSVHFSQYTFTLHFFIFFQNWTGTV